MCTIGEFSKALDLTPNDVIMPFNGGYSDENEDIDADKHNTPKVAFYPSSYHTINGLDHNKSIVLSVINKIICFIPRKCGESLGGSPSLNLIRLDIYLCMMYCNIEWEHYSRKIEGK